MGIFVLLIWGKGPRHCHARKRTDAAQCGAGPGLQATLYGPLHCLELRREPEAVAAVNDDVPGCASWPAAMGATAAAGDENSCISSRRDGHDAILSSISSKYLLPRH